MEKTIPKYDASYKKIRGSKHLEVEYNDYDSLLKSEMTTEQAVIILIFEAPFYWDCETSISRGKREAGKSKFIQDFLRWHSKKDVAPTSEVILKMMLFTTIKISMLKNVCTLSNLATNCLHKSTDAKIYPFT